jgi:hypothetical protein
MFYMQFHEIRCRKTDKAATKATCEFISLHASPRLLQLL